MNVFLSYQMEDLAFRDIFSRDVSSIEPSIAFRDYPKVDYFDPEWQQRCSDLIRECVGTIVLIGYSTYQSEPVLWEIAETQRQGRPLVGVVLHDAGQSPTLGGLDGEDLIPIIKIDAVVSRIRSWSS